MANKVTFEVSLKAFRDQTEAGIRQVAERIFLQWQPLFKDMKEISIMFWTADGSEILDYKGNLDDTFEWCKYIGVANPEIYGEIPDLPQAELSIHHSPRLFCDNPPDYTYRDLKRVLDGLRQVFAERGRQIRLGATFDPGPEFAVSSFKYKRHHEVCMSETMGVEKVKSFVCCYATLDQDDTPYAGFPNGIAQGTDLGTFLGRQTRCFCHDLGFDYLWLSNGFGFGLETWGVCGAVFDGESFDSSACAEVGEKGFRFWTSFREELPDLPIENRGTNLSTGMDLSSDAVPLREIYAQVPDIAAPPNSPWAALNGDFGMELAGWLSHIAELPKDGGYPFRFYTHDPWFINSPWLDRYGRNPHDIYMPLALTRVTEQGNVMGPERISFLTIDDSYGDMPDAVPDEVIPHIKAGLASAPDVAGPVIWLYPFDEYHDMTFSGEGVDEVFFGDWFMRTAINTGFQLNTVVSTKHFGEALAAGQCQGNVVVAPTAIARNEQVLQQVLDFVSNGGKVLLYGPLNDSALLNALGLEQTRALDGELSITAGDMSGTIKHNPLYCAGGIDTVATDSRSLAQVSKGKEQRDVATLKALGQGQLAWVRGTNSFDIQFKGRYPQMHDRKVYFYAETLMREMLGRLGYRFELDKYAVDTPDVVMVTNYHANAMYVSTYSPDMTVTERLSFPEGAPVFVQTETIIKDGMSVYHFPKAEHLECRVFVEMDAGWVKCVEFCLCTPEVKRRLMVEGLENATVRFRPETGFEETTQALLNPGAAPYVKGNFLEPQIETDFAGTVLTYRNVTGAVLFSW